MSAGDEQARALARIEAFRDRVPRFDDAVVTLAHGAGGKATAALVEDVFVSRLGRGPEGDPLADAAVLDPSGDERLAFTTDAFVVTPRRFPGGSVGHLAVHGTVNDLAMVGARPEALSLAVVLEEGFAVAELRDLVDDIAAAADVAGVRVVTGDTKVVGRGAVDGVCLVTAGIGRIPAGRDLAARHVRPGDRLLVSGTLGDHGMAVMLARGGFYQKTGGNWVYVVNDDGSEAVKRDIRLGRQNTQVFEVLEGLQPGEQVITSSYDNYGDIDKLILKN